MWDDLVCPHDRGDLHAHGDWLACQTCGRGYPVLDSIPTFLPATDDPRWQHIQARRLADLPVQPPESAWERSTSIRRRARALEELLAPYVELAPATKVLQVGVKGEAEVHHFRCGVRYGVEPLAGVMVERGLLKWGQVRWVAGRGEELPFPDRNFQVILLGSVLDGVESPERVLAEAGRCLADDGVLWLSCRVRAAGWLAALRGLACREALPVGRSLWDFTAGQLIRACRRARFRPLWSMWSSDQAVTAAAAGHPGGAPPQRWLRTDRTHVELVLAPSRRTRSVPARATPRPLAAPAR